jgi:hypothetical protein
MSEPYQEDNPPKQTGSFLTLPALFAVAWIIYEVTHEPSFAALAMCLKFGWEDFRTAWWLRRTDPDRGRARACAWLYLAAGLWQTAIIGVAMVFLTVALTEVVQVQQGGVRDILSLIQGATVAIVFGFILSTVATVIALICAARAKVRPWLNGAVHFARRRGEWPPLYGRRNRVMLLVGTAIAVAFCVLLPVVLMIAAAAADRGGRQKGALAFISLLGVLAFVVLLPATVLFVRRGFYADHPADCWGTEPLPVNDDETNRHEAA